MNAAQFVSNVFLVATGKLPTFASGTTKWLKILAIGNNKINSWEREYDWHSLYDPSFTVGTVTATNTFPLDDSIQRISNQPNNSIVITRTNGNKSYWQTVKPQQLKLYPTGNYCAQVGRNLVFNNAFVLTDADFGGTITAPIYTFADNLVNDNDVVPVDDPNWLVLVSAAEYVRTDVTRQNQYAPLTNEANALLEQMKANTDPQTEELDKPYRPLSTEW